MPITTASTLIWANAPDEILYTDLLQRTAEMAGRDYATLSTDEQTALRGFIGDATKKIWEEEFWPDLMTYEERPYRILWRSAVAYTSSTEVYHSATDKYWTANATTTAGEEPGTSSKWGSLDIDRAYIPRWPTGYIPLGDVESITTKDPRKSNSYQTYDFVPAHDGVTVEPRSRELQTTVWVKHRRKAPFFDATDWSATGSYSEETWFYYSTTDRFSQNFSVIADDGSSSGSTVIGWNIPKIFAPYITRAAAADMLLQDEKVQLAGALQAKADDYLLSEKEKLFFQQGQLPKIRVKGY